MGILAGIRYVLFAGSLGKKYSGMWGDEGPLFEYEAGGANLAVGIVALVSYFKKFNYVANACILLIYAFYLFFALLVHIYVF